MAYSVNYVKCPKCGHDRNPSTAAKCEICGNPLKGASIPPIVWILGAALLLGAAGYFAWKQFAPQFPTTATTTTTTPGTTTTAPVTGNANPVTSPQITLYNSMQAVENVPSGLFNYGGSTTFAPLRSTTVTAAITQAHPGFQLRYTEPPTGKPGSGTGIKMLIDGELSVAQSSRPLKDEEIAKAKDRGINLEAVPVAIDGIAFYVNPDLARLPGLNLSQIRDIFTGKITNWSKVGGPNLPIKAFSRDLKAGGTVDFVNETLLEKKGFGQNITFIRDTTESLRKVANTPGGIGYATASEVIGQSTVRPLPLAEQSGQTFYPPFTEGGQVNVEAFREGKYPVTRRLFVVIRRDGRLDEQAGAAYANLLLSSEGQRLVEQVGFVPIR